MRTHETNPHADSAKTRSEADAFISAFATGNGYQLYSISASAKDGYQHIPGTRDFWFEKDLRLVHRSDSLPEPHKALIKMIDVDYYVQEKEIREASFYGQGAILYTMIPEALAYSDGQTMVTVAADGTVTEAHSGSTPYVHKLWDWRRDYVTFQRFSMWDIFSSITHCYVDFKRVNLNRYVVLVTPVMTGNIIASLIWSLIGSCRPLEKWSPLNINGVNVLTTSTGMILARPNAARQHEITHAQYSEMLYDPHLNPADVNRIMGTQTSYELTAMMVELQKAEHVTQIPRVFTARDPRAYKVEWPDVFDNDSVKIRGQHYMPAIVDNTWVPANCKSNDLTCIEHRLTRPQSKLSPPNPRYERFISEFVEQVVRTPGTLLPLSFGQVLDEANSTQRNKWANALSAPLEYMHKAFQKTESYNSIKAPRNISAVDPQHVATFSRFTKPLSNFLKTTHWYCFGCPPLDMGAKVKDIACNMAMGDLIEGDFSAYDGTQSTLLVDLNTALMCRAFDPSYSEEIRALRYDLSYSVFTSSNGVTYNTADSQKSGSASTSVDNTISHAFCQYCHFRDLNIGPDEAYARIGLCAGDDGLLRTPNHETYMRTCANLGMVLKAKLLLPGDPISFLGRVWTNWSSPESFCDPFRALSKFHFSSNSDRNVAQSVLAWRKAVGYYVTDAHNFVGHIARKVLSLCRSGKIDVQERREYLMQSVGTGTVQAEHLFEKFADSGVYSSPYSSHETLMCEDGSLCPSFRMFCEQTKKSEAEVLAWYTRFIRVTHLDDVVPLMSVEDEPPEHFTVTIKGHKLLGPAITSPGDKDFPSPAEASTDQGSSKKEETVPEKKDEEKKKYQHPNKRNPPNESSGKKTVPAAKFTPHKPSPDTKPKPSATPTKKTVPAPKKEGTVTTKKPAPAPTEGASKSPTRKKDAAPRPPDAEFPVCKRHFHGGKCTRGSECKFLHDIKGICRDELHGKCTYGDKCKYQHARLSADV
jgi:hypothetical protein